MKRVWKSRGEQAGNFLDQVLLRRGVASAPEREIFFNPKYEQSFDPFLLKDMEKAVERVVRAVEKEEKITIYADYDADAVTAAAVLLRFFEQAGFKNADCYIPDRFSEGYGMNVESVETLRERGTNLIITVDCGINALEPVMKASQLGIDVVVTDHHRLTGPLPNACAVVNQHRPDDEYPFKDLTGVGVAFKLVQALAGRMKIKAGWEKWLLDLVAIGTVADCQSLLSENRIFVK
ncbi:single-stranded-DNA-specific exonuclease RecJ, partial [bacterium]